MCTGLLKSVKISLESSDVVFRRSHLDGETCKLSGSVQFSTPTETAVRSAKITLKGVRRVFWIPNSYTQQCVQQKDVFLRDEFRLHPSAAKPQRGEKLSSGSHSWPFTFSLGAHLPETVDALLYSYIQYYLEAEVRTAGFWSRPTHTVQQIRVIKSPSFLAGATDGILEQSKEDIWPDRLSYRIALPKVHHALGRPMAVAFQLTPLHPDVRIGSIRLALVQTTTLVATAKDGQLWRADKTATTVAAATVSPPAADSKDDGFWDDDADDDDDGGGAGAALLGGAVEMRDEAFRFSVALDTSQELYARVQSLSDEKIKVHYALKATVDLLRPGGRVSKVEVAFKPRLYVATEEDVGHEAFSDDVHDFREGSRTPPLYRDHVRDLLYQEEAGSPAALPAYGDI